jgi:hypothetical protein
MAAMETAVAPFSLKARRIVNTGMHPGELKIWEDRTTEVGGTQARKNWREEGEGVVLLGLLQMLYLYL